MWTWLPISCAAISLIITLTRLPALMAATFRYADLPELPVIAHALAAGRGPLTLPTQDSIAVIWTDRLLDLLSLHAGIEQWIGPLVAVAAASLLVRCAWLAAGPRAALYAACLLAVLPPTVMWPALYSDAHITSVFGMALLLWLHVQSVRGKTRVATAICVGLISGLLLVSDPQLVAFGFVPYVALGALHSSRRRAALRSYLSCLVATAAGVAATLAAMSFQGIQVASYVPALSVGNLSAGFSSTMWSLGWIADGGWFADEIAPITIPMLLIAALAVACLVMIAWRTTREMAVAHATDAVALVSYRAFLLLGIATLMSAFVIGGYGQGRLGGHYLMPVYFAACATLASARRTDFVPSNMPSHLRKGTRRSVRRLITVCSVAFAVFALHNGLAVGTVDARLFSDGWGVTGADDPLPALLAHHLSRGYTNYWDAYDLDWRSSGQLDVWPVLPAPGACNAAPGNLCRYPFAPSGAYRPAAGSSFILTRSQARYCLTSQPSVRVFGQPSSVYRAMAFTVWVYPYDVASRFSAAPSAPC